MHASWHLCRLQLTGDSSVENLYGSVEMLRMLMKTVGFRVRLNNSQVHFARVAVRDSPCMESVLLIHVALYVFLWEAEEKKQFISKCNVNIVFKMCIFFNLFLH